MTWVSTLAERARREGWPTLDLAAALALVIVAVGAEAAKHGGVFHTVALVVCAATVAARRRWPAGACAVALVAVTAFDHSGAPVGLNITGFAIALDYYILGRRVAIRGWRLAEVLLLSVPVPMVAASPEGSSLASVITLVAVFALVPFTAGWGLAAAMT
jgi:hypothetical protein